MKRFFYLIFILFGLIFTIISCSSDSTNEESTINEDIEEPLSAEVNFDVFYGPDSQQVYDIYLPAGRTSEKTKVIILVHGGGWTSGDKTDMNSFIGYIQQDQPKHALVNINYRLADLTPPFIPAFPNQFLDLGLVIDQLISQKEDLQILPEFGLIGVSAGAHISLMYDYGYDTHNVVKMVCDIVGPTDFTDPHYSNNPAFNLFLAAITDESAYPIGTNYAEATSPVFQVSSNSSPSILFYGNQDPLVPLTNGERLNDALSDASINHSFTVYDGGHGDDWSDASFLDLEEQINGFIDTYLFIEE